MKVHEIQDLLKNKSKEKVKKSCQKFVPGCERAYGVKIPELNNLAIEYKEEGFELVEKLWKAGAFEEKILATKILSKICEKDPNKSLKLIKKFSSGICDWAVCDTLATQGIKAISKVKQKEIFDISKKLVSSKNLWQRRFALVLLINFAKDNNLKREIKEIVKKTENDKEYYVRKAVRWLNTI